MKALFERAGFKIDDVKLVDPLNDSPNYVLDGFRNVKPLSLEAKELLASYQFVWVENLRRMGIVCFQADIEEVFQDWSLCKSAGPGLNALFKNKGEAMLTYFIENFEPCGIPIAYVKEEVIKMLKYMEGRFRVIHSVPGRNLLEMRCFLYHWLEAFKTAGLTKSGWDLRKDLPNHFKEWNRLVAQHGWTHIIADVSNCELSIAPELIADHQDVLRRFGIDLPQHLKEFELRTPFAASWKENGVWTNGVVHREGGTLSGIYTTGVMTTHVTSKICFIAAMLKGYNIRTSNTSDDIDVLIEGSISLEEFSSVFELFGFKLKTARIVRTYQDYECMGATLRQTSHGLQPVWDWDKILVRLCYVDSKDSSMFSWAMRAAQSLSYVCYHEQFPKFWREIFVPIVQRLPSFERDHVLTCFTSNVAAYEVLQTEAAPVRLPMEAVGGKTPMAASAKANLSPVVAMMCDPMNNEIIAVPDKFARPCALSKQHAMFPIAPSLQNSITENQRRAIVLLMNDPRFPLWVEDTDGGDFQYPVREYIRLFRTPEGLLQSDNPRDGVDNLMNFFKLGFSVANNCTGGLTQNLPLVGCICIDKQAKTPSSLQDKFLDTQLILPAMSVNGNIGLPAGVAARFDISGRISLGNTGTNWPVSTAMVDFNVSWEQEDGTLVTTGNSVLTPPTMASVTATTNSFSFHVTVSPPNDTNVYRILGVNFIPKVVAGVASGTDWFFESISGKVYNNDVTPSLAGFSKLGVFRPKYLPSLSSWQNEGAYVRTGANTLLIREVSNALSQGGAITFTPIPQDVSITSQVYVDPEFFASKRGSVQYREQTGGFVAMCPDHVNVFKPSISFPKFSGNLVFITITTPDSPINLSLDLTASVEIISDSQTWNVTKASPDPDWERILQHACGGDVWLFTSENPKHPAKARGFFSHFFSVAREVLPYVGRGLSMVPNPVAKAIGTAMVAAGGVDDAVTAAMKKPKPKQPQQKQPSVGKAVSDAAKKEALKAKVKANKEVKKFLEGL